MVRNSFATCLFMVCALALRGDAAEKETKMLKIGDVAPGFELKGTDGKSYKLVDFKGKSAVIVAWYPKALTGG